MEFFSSDGKNDFYVQTKFEEALFETQRTVL